MLLRRNWIHHRDPPPVNRSCMSSESSRCLVHVPFRNIPEIETPSPAFVLPSRRRTFTPTRPAVTVAGMEDLRTLECTTKDRRREARINADLPLRVWGVDTRGERFLQHAQARDISLSGALLSGLDTELRSGDVIGILYVGKKARYRVVWVRHSGSAHKVQAAVQRFASDECPWKELLAVECEGDRLAASLLPGTTLED